MRNGWWMIDQKTIDNIEDVIEKAWDKKDYIRCYNTSKYLLSLDPDNKLAKEYMDILSSVDLKFEYIKYAKKFQQKSYFYIVFSFFVSLAFSFLFVEDYFMDYITPYIEEIVPIYFWYNYVFWFIFFFIFFSFFKSLFNFIINKSTSMSIKWEDS